MLPSGVECSRCKVLEEHINKLEIRINELEDRLNNNSGNSSLPPSSDFQKRSKKNKKNKDRISSTKKVGGQLGHKGNHRKLVDNPDETISIKPSDICECGGDIVVDDSNPHKIQKIEIPKIKPHVTEYRLLRGECSCCGKRINASLPDGVTPDLLGNNAKSIIAMMTGYFKNSRREVVDIMRNIFNLEISLGLVSKTEERVSDKCETAFNELKDSLSDLEILHIDETSNNYRGKMGWSWIFANPFTTLLKWEVSRSKKVLEKILPDYHGYVISDRYAGYNYFDSSNRQICWAHLLRNFEKFSDSSFPEVREFGSLLVFYTKRLFIIYRGHKKGILERQYFVRHANKIRKRLRRYLHRISAESSSEYIRRQADNILKYEDMMWLFLQDIENIPLTNNHAEQEIRRFVIHRKNSFFTWGIVGQQYLERMISIFQTCKKRGLNPADVLRNLIQENIKIIPAA